MHPVKTVTVGGRVLGPEGPVTRGSVTLRESDEEEYGSDHYDFTDDKGNFKLKGIPLPDTPEAGSRQRRHRFDCACGGRRP